MSWNEADKDPRNRAEVWIMAPSPSLFLARNTYEEQVLSDALASDDGCMNKCLLLKGSRLLLLPEWGMSNTMQRKKGKEKKNPPIPCYAATSIGQKFAPVLVNIKP